MDYKNENLQNEQGSMQQQKERDEQDHSGHHQREKAPVSEITGSDADEDRGGEPSLDDDESQSTANFEHEDDRSVKNKRSYWNSITFDNDDFFGALAPV